MAKDSDHLAGGFEIENTGGFLSGLLAEEDQFDRRSLWRLGSWGVASVGAVILALLANQSSIGLRREQMAAADQARQSQQIQSVAKESQSEARRLASAIDTLNGDRDRLYARVTVLEQGLDSVTGAPAASPQAAASASATTDSSQPAPQNPAPAPAVSPVAAAPATTTEKPSVDTATATRDSSPAKVSSTGQAASNSPAATPATPLMPAKSMLAPPDAAAGKLIQPEARANAVVSAPMPEVVATVSPADAAQPDASKATPPQATPPQATPKVTLQRTEFGVDVGGANSVGGLRALWRGLLKSKSNAPLATLRPIIVVKESNSGLGMQLRLVAGPLGDAAAAAKICAALLESERTCETTVFDGQRLAMTPEEPSAAVKPSATRRRGSGKRAAAVVEEPPQKQESPSTLSALFGKR